MRVEEICSALHHAREYRSSSTIKRLWSGWTYFLKMFYIVGCSLFKPQLLPLAPGKNSLLRTGRSTICGALPKPQAHCMVVKCPALILQYIDFYIQYTAKCLKWNFLDGLFRYFLVPRCFNILLKLWKSPINNSVLTNMVYCHYYKYVHLQ